MYTKKKASAKATNSAKKSASSIITDIRVYPVEGDKESNLLAMVSVTFCDLFVVTGLKIIDGKKGLFVSMPSIKTREGKYKDSAFPVTKEFRKVLSDSILNAFDALQEDCKNEDESEDD
jgi:stage V sporulation protein G